MKFAILDKTGTKTGDITLEDAWFNVPFNKAVIAQYIRVFLSNQRQGTASVKTRGEVSGSGAKPWPQKHLGRARVGTKRNPLWYHGGVAHGPKPKSWRLKLPKKVKSLALRIALSHKASTNGLVVVEPFKISTPKTKEMKQILENIKAIHGHVLIVTAKADKGILKSCSNLPKVSVSHASNVNAYEVLRADTVVFFKDALESLKERYHASK